MVLNENFNPQGCSRVAAQLHCTWATAGPPKSGPAFEHDQNTKKMWLKQGKSRTQFINKSD